VTEFAADIAQTYDCKSGIRDRIILCGSFVLGSSGAIASQSVDDPQMVATKAGGAGTYTLTFPKALRGFLRASGLVGTTIFGCQVTLFDAGAGTATFLTLNAAGAAANGTAADVISWQLILDTNK
jgi:hypothetical protein